MVETEICERHGSKLALWSRVNDLFALWVIYKPVICNRGCDWLGGKGATTALDPVVTFSRLPCAEKSTGFPVAPQVKAGNTCFVLLPTCFQKEQPQNKKWQSTETLAGLTSLLEMFVQLEERRNTKLICMWESQNPHWKNCGKKHKERGKYPVDATSDKCSCFHCRYPVPSTELLKIVFDRSLAQDLEPDAGFMQLPQ